MQLRVISLTIHVRIHPFIFDHLINKSIVTRMLRGYFLPERYYNMSCSSSTPELLNQYKPDNVGHLKVAATPSSTETLTRNKTQITYVVCSQVNDFRKSSLYYCIQWLRRLCLFSNTHKEHIAALLCYLCWSENCFWCHFKLLRLSATHCY